MCVGFEEFSDADGKLVVLESESSLGVWRHQRDGRVFIQLGRSNPATCWPSRDMNNPEVAGHSCLGPKPLVTAHSPRSTH